ncbi:MAG: PadR family transcriptional regulator [Candidatus Aenigmarchaeota archaeon]|nr:PadR family transcriptional regulator [Candidatus Aenigmarchaeota archaeon]NIP40076.1 PadR family transcriptional regulator [Candidatus Aenigmarchaeota archaeon]NIQ18153.1 PadR family transcriptional regulator [Candidatus Aenigmarchaeota archaeon]NIS72910.1 PadR family transcriptional regulator [Candidatus Aenigmarchaeota archaeon]
MPLKKLEKNNTSECLWPYILRILKDKPSHAYVLRKEIERRFGFKPGNVTAYLVLYSLRKKGYVGKKKEGRKQVYSITKKGEEILRKSIKFYKERIKILE